jgi:hypothetical protein
LITDYLLPTNQSVYEMVVIAQGLWRRCVIVYSFPTSGGPLRQEHFLLGRDVVGAWTWHPLLFFYR